MRIDIRDIIPIAVLIIFAAVFCRAVMQSVKAVKVHKNKALSAAEKKREYLGLLFLWAAAVILFFAAVAAMIISAWGYSMWGYSPWG